ncbi:four helix bundle protein [Zunongwangia sp. HGR-M22]|uniref:four helix bundle protein n=1 Tax=Zunongwangia sp. HGR-M22 TaxID=3015168 RepID=UPI002FD3435C
MKIWKEGISIVEITYKLVENFPSIEKFNLSNQLIRCAVSIPSNIAEGTSKTSEKHFANFLETSLGSSFEWETQIIIAFKLGYVSKENFEDLENKIQQLQRMISKFIDNLK